LGYKEEKPEKTKTPVSITEILLLIFLGLPIILFLFYLPLIFIIDIYGGNKNDKEENLMEDDEGDP
jgi:Fe2+ transport system protein B